MAAVVPREPHEVFQESWALRTAHLPRVSPISNVDRERSPAFRALEDARLRAEQYAKGVLGWPHLEAKLAAGQMAIVLMHWLRTDGEDREQLRQWLIAYQEKGRAEAVLGLAAVEKMEIMLTRQLELSLDRAG